MSDRNIPTDERSRDIESVIARLRFGDSDGDDHDIAANEIGRLRADLAIQAVNAKAVLDAEHERDCMRTAVGIARSYILDHGDERTAAPIVDLLDRALGFVPLPDDVPCSTNVSTTGE